MNQNTHQFSTVGSCLVLSQTASSINVAVILKNTIEKLKDVGCLVGADEFEDNTGTVSYTWFVPFRLVQRDDRISHANYIRWMMNVLLLFNLNGAFLLNRKKIWFSLTLCQQTNGGLYISLFFGQWNLFATKKNINSSLLDWLSSNISIKRRWL